MGQSLSSTRLEPNGRPSPKDNLRLPPAEELVPCPELIPTRYLHGSYPAAILPLVSWNPLPEPIIIVHRAGVSNNLMSSFLKVIKIIAKKRKHRGELWIL